MKAKDIIGVDCGKHFGDCHYRKPDTIVALINTDFLGFIEWAGALDPADVRFIVEDPTKHRPTFARGFEQQLVQAVYKKDTQQALKVMRMTNKGGP